MYFLHSSKKDLSFASEDGSIPNGPDGNWELVDLGSTCNNRPEDVGCLPWPTLAA